MNKDILDKIKGLSDLLFAAAAQSESCSCLRTEGILALAGIASDIEHDLEDYINSDLEGDITQ